MGKILLEPPPVIEFSKGSWAQCLASGHIEVDIQDELSIYEAGKLMKWLERAIRYCMAVQKQRGH